MLSFFNWKFDRSAALSFLGSQRFVQIKKIKEAVRVAKFAKKESLWDQCNKNFKKCLKRSLWRHSKWSFSPPQNAEIYT